MLSDLHPGQHSPEKRVDTAIVIGGGVVGQAVASALQARGVDTTVIDPHGAPQGASWGNAGHIAIEQVEPLASRATIASVPARLFRRGGPLAWRWRDLRSLLPFVRGLIAASHPVRFAAGRTALRAMLGDAIGAWRRLLARIGDPALLREDGHFVVWESAASAARGRVRWAAADIGGATIRDATPDEMASLAALTSQPLAGAIRFGGSGQIADLGALATALAEAFAHAGGARRQASVARLDKSGRRCAVRLDDGTRLEADAVIVAAGARSAALLRPLGHRVPLVAERGYHIQSAETAWPESIPPVVFEDRAMIVTRFRGGLRAASFVEFGLPDTAPDPRKWSRLRAHVQALGLSFRLPGAEWMGARPTLPDYLPAIGRSGAADNLYYAFGHQHLGLTLAATTGEAVAALIHGEAPPFDLAPFVLDRFGVVS